MYFSFLIKYSLCHSIRLYCKLWKWSKARYGKMAHFVPLNCGNFSCSKMCKVCPAFKIYNYIYYMYTFIETNNSGYSHTRFCISDSKQPFWLLICALETFYADLKSVHECILLAECRIKKLKEKLWHYQTFALENNFKF